MIHLKRAGDFGSALDRKDCTLRMRAAREFRLLLIGVVVIGSMTFAVGCESSKEGTSAAFNPEANKKQQDAMRDYMMKNKNSLPGQGARAKK